MKLKIDSCLIIALAMCCGLRVAAQNATPSLCSLIVNVMDSRGNPIRDYKKDNFRVEVDKHPVSISTNGYQLLPRRVVIVLDLSGSMTARDNPNKWEVARTALQTFLTLTPPQMPVALLAFSGKALATFGFDHDRASMLGWLNKADDQSLGLARPTALYDGLLEGLKMLEPHQDGDSIYVITDGKDNSSVTASQERLKEELLKDRVRLFTFLLSERLTEESRVGNAIMSTANETGGFVLGRSAEGGSIFYSSFEMNDHVREAIKGQTAQLDLWIGGFYSLNIASRDFRDRSRVSVEVVEDKGKHRRGLVVTFPHKLASCSSGLVN